ncbi:MAG: N-6 DNA methylase, partial [Kiritimatiellae bacterium]|nr:N-6 DNA methylase [Kiritimatiellia bacterium]
ETIVRILVEVLQPAAGMRIYDPCHGSGGMFSQSMKFIETHSGNRGDVAVFGQEANPDTWKMSKINMAIRGIGADFGMGHEDTLMHDIHAGTQMDRIFANPPFNQKKWGADRVKDDPRWKYGLPPDGNANYAWIQHMISHLKPRGRIGLVLANGALTSATGGEDKIRQAIIEDDLVEGIVSLPPQLFYSVTIPVTLWFFNRAKDQPGNTLFINATSLGHMVDRTHRVFSDEDIAKIAATFEKFRNGKFRKEEGFAAVATTKEIAEKKFKLTPGLYAGGKVEEDDSEPFDAKMKRLTGELGELFGESARLEKLIRKNLGAIGYEV